MNDFVVSQRKVAVKIYDFIQRPTNNESSLLLFYFPILGNAGNDFYIRPLMILISNLYTDFYEFNIIMYFFTIVVTYT